MKIKKILTLALASLLVVSCLTGCNKDANKEAYADENTSSQSEDTNEAGSDDAGTSEDAEGNIITKEFLFYSATEDGLKFEIPQFIEVDGKKYQFTGNAEYQTSEIMSVVTQTLDLEVVNKDDVEKEYIYKSKTGKTYKLHGDLFYFSEKVPIQRTIRERVEYSLQLGKPNIPAEKDIEYYNDVTQKDEVIKGKLVDSGVASSDWEKGYAVDAVFSANHESVSEWSVTGKDKTINVSQTAEAPVWENYQNEVISLLGLDPSVYRCTGATWNGDSYNDESGMLKRNATFHCEAFTSSYWAEYEGKGEAMGYKTRVTYYEYADLFKNSEIDPADISVLYKMVAIASYKEVTE